VIGKTFHHYTIVKKLGEGGMGLVYLADDTSLDRKVALKFLPESLQQDPTARKLFLREAKSAAALDHPFICNIFQVGEEDGTVFIAMEYVQGETLKDVMIDGPIPLNETIRIAAEIAEAMEKAHQEGIIHRDLKPSNIMLTPEGHVKVMDFGLAKQVVTIEQGEGADLTVSLGTPGYMSPEQLRGERLNTRSDLFSFGILLFEMLTGTHPFKREQPFATALAILSDPPPQLDEYLSDPPKPLIAILEKTLRKDSDQRFSSTSELREGLFALLTAGIQRPRLLERPALIATGIMLVVLIAGLFLRSEVRGHPMGQRWCISRDSPITAGGSCCVHWMRSLPGHCSPFRLDGQPTISSGLMIVPRSISTRTAKYFRRFPEPVAWKRSSSPCQTWKTWIFPPRGMSCPCQTSSPRIFTPPRMSSRSGDPMAWRSTRPMVRG